MKVAALIERIGTLLGTCVRAGAPPLLALLIGWPVLASEPVGVRADLALGYDSNPAQAREGEGLAFTRCAVEAARVWPLDGTALGLTASGWYRDSEAANDSYRLALSGDWARETHSGAGLLKVSISGAAYRDQRVPADARDEAALGLRYSYILSARHTLGLSAEWRRLAYRNASLPWAGRPGSDSASGAGRRSGSGAGSESGSESGRGASGSGRSGGAVPVRRDDDRLTLGLDLARHWGPDLVSVVSAAHARNDSEVAAEAYDRDGLGLTLRFAPRDPWRIELGLDGALIRYDRAPRHRKREDLELGLTLAVRRALPAIAQEAGEFYCALEWMDSDSTLAERSFQQQVTQCGFSWAFR